MAKIGAPPEEMFRTTDYRLAGFLHARGVRWRGSEFNAKNEMVFKFENVAGDATKTADQYPKSQETAYDKACQMFNSMARAGN